MNCKIWTAIDGDCSEKEEKPKLRVAMHVECLTWYCQWVVVLVWLLLYLVDAKGLSLLEWHEILNLGSSVRRFLLAHLSNQQRKGFFYKKCYKKTKELRMKATKQNEPTRKTIQ